MNPEVAGRRVRIAVDAMGGDHGLPVTVPATVAYARAHDDVELVLVGQEAEVDAALRQALGNTPARIASRITVRNATQVVAMDEPPASALRGKRDSSMRIAIELVRDGQADACISAGNSGALMAISRFVLKMLEGIDRPAMASQLPNQRDGRTIVLDLGANVDCEPQHLLQFAVMGSALASVLENVERPSVGLLNVGEELIKGNDTVKQAAELLRASSLNFHGNVEGDDIYRGTTDVVVCDGFVGNVALKTSEGLAQMLGGFIREEYQRHIFTRMMALLSMPVLKRFKRRLDHRRYNGASLVGLRGIVIKSHGSADAYAFEFALSRAHDAARNGLLGRIEAQLPRIRSSDVGVAPAQPAV